MTDVVFALTFFFFFFSQKLSKRNYVIGGCGTYVSDLWVTKEICVADFAMCVQKIIIMKKDLFMKRHNILGHRAKVTLSRSKCHPEICLPK